MAKKIILMMPDSTLYALQNPCTFTTLAGIILEYGMKQDTLLVIVDQTPLPRECYGDPLDPDVNDILIMVDAISVLSRRLVESLIKPGADVHVPLDVRQTFSRSNVRFSAKDFIDVVVRGYFIPLSGREHMFQFYWFVQDNETVGSFLKRCDINPKYVKITIHQADVMIWTGNCLDCDDELLSQRMLPGSIMMIESQDTFTIPDSFNKLLFRGEQAVIPDASALEVMKHEFSSTSPSMSRRIPQVALVHSNQLY